MRCGRFPDLEAALAAARMEAQPGYAVTVDNAVGQPVARVRCARWGG